MPNRIRSWYLTKKSCAARGWRPMSYSTAPTSVYTFGISSSILPSARQVVRVPAHVRGDERRLRMPAEQVVALGHQLLEARKPVRRIAAVGEERELEPALVVVVDRLEELLRIGGVDEHRQVQPRARVPDRIERRDRRCAGAMPSGFLIDRPRLLEISPTPTAPAVDVRLELPRPPSRPSRARRCGKLIPASTRTRSFIFGDAFDRRERVLQPIARQVVGRHHHADVQLVELAPPCVEPLLRVDQRPPGCPWKSIAGYFARRHQVRRRSPASTAAGSRRCSAAGTRAPCSCAAGSRSARPGTLRRPGCWRTVRAARRGRCRARRWRRGGDEHRTGDAHMAAHSTAPRSGAAGCMPSSPARGGSHGLTNVSSQMSGFRAAWKVPSQMPFSVSWPLLIA